MKRRARPRTLWSRYLDSCRYAQALPNSDQENLRDLVSRFMKSKVFEGASGLIVTDAMRVRIALHACIPILNLGLNYYADWADIVIYPGDFRVRNEYTDEYGIVQRETMDLCGQSLSPGPIVLSWETLRAEDKAPTEHDLVIHECAHKLDVLNGPANGFPPLHSDMNPREWAQDLQAAYDRLCSGLDNGVHSRLDPYGAEDPSEFFAVLSEMFFTTPKIIKEDFPAAYQQLQYFYRQNPHRFMDEMPKNRS